MRVPCSEGLADHTVPESCVGAREGVGEALTGVRVGRPLSREKGYFQGADAVHAAEGNTAGRPCVVGDTGMRVRSLPGNREISRPTGGLHGEVVEPCRRSVSGR